MSNKLSQPVVIISEGISLSNTSTEIRKDLQQEANIKVRRDELNAEVNKLLDITTYDEYLTELRKSKLFLGDLMDDISMISKLISKPNTVGETAKIVFSGIIQDLNYTINHNWETGKNSQTIKGKIVSNMAMGIKSLLNSADKAVDNIKDYFIGTSSISESSYMMEKSAYYNKLFSGTNYNIGDIVLIGKIIKFKSNVNLRLVVKDIISRVTGEEGIYDESFTKDIFKGEISDDNKKVNEGYYTIQSTPNSYETQRSIMVNTPNTYIIKTPLFEIDNLLPNQISINYSDYKSKDGDPISATITMGFEFASKLYRQQFFKILTSK